LIVRKPLDIFELRGRVDDLVRGKATAGNEGEVSAP
jgi:hypothetical protein